VFQEMIKCIDSDLSAASRLKSKTAEPELAGDGALPSCFAVSGFSQSAIATATNQLLQLRHECWGVESQATIDRALSTQWCSQSVVPMDGWEVPGAWDEFAADYCAQDGWIRLHTNAPHHRQRALKVLGHPANKQQAVEAVAQWRVDELEGAVVDAGGAAAAMRSSEQWRAHKQGLAVSQEPVISWQVTDLPTNAPVVKPELSDANLPLKGLRVLDLTRVIAGPVCTRFLASFGANVLRIDPPDWQEGANILEMTVGKRCTGLDLTQPADKQVFEQLVSEAHVLVHGYRANALEELGLGKDWRQNVNPYLIQTGLNAYGWTGPWKNRRGFDSLVQMSTGIAHRGQQVYNASKPVPLPYQALDHVTGYLMAASTLYALRLLMADNKVGYSRVSLARQSMLLQQLSEKYGATTEQNLRALGTRDLNNAVEQSAFGRLQRYQLPYVFSDIQPAFAQPITELRMSSPSW